MRLRPMTRVAVTGSRNAPVTEAQRDELMALLDYLCPEILHHGDCLGWDAFCCQAAQERGIDTIVHPPTNAVARAFTKGNAEVRPLYPYLERDKRMLVEVHARAEPSLLIAGPEGTREMLRSGTWATVRYARKIQLPRIIVWPNGDVNVEAYG